MTLPVSFDGDTTNFEKKINYAIEFTNGTTDGKIDKIWYDTSRVLAATSEEIDLAGSLTGPDGATVTFAKVRGILVINTSTTSGQTLKIGGAAANAFPLFDNATDIYSLDPDSCFFVTSKIDGKTVTAGTGDLLKIDAGAATITYHIAVLGTSA